MARSAENINLRMWYLAYSITGWSELNNEHFQDHNPAQLGLSTVDQEQYHGTIPEDRNERDNIVISSPKKLKETVLILFIFLEKLPTGTVRVTLLLMPSIDS